MLIICDINGSFKINKSIQKVLIYIFTIHFAVKLNAKCLIAERLLSELPDYDFFQYLTYVAIINKT